MAQYFFRSENIPPEDLAKLIVTAPLEEGIIDLLKSNANLLVEGSRGTGKSFLMKYAAHQLEADFKNRKILPVYITFMASTLIHTTDQFQFRNWMLARALRELVKSGHKQGLIFSSYASSLLNINLNDQTQQNLSQLITAYEASYKSQNVDIDASFLPELNDVIDALDDICRQNQLTGIYFYFDEAAHIFRPEQQRQFFTLFRDFRSPYVASKAAIYPGTSHFGDTFELTHDAVLKKLDRNIQDAGYLDFMLSVVDKQIDEVKKKAIQKNKEAFNTVAFCAYGNPRLLLKTVERISSFNSSEADQLVRSFYRSEIWSEHTQLGDKYKGHKPLVDWGRKFVEDIVIPNLVRRNFLEDGSSLRNDTTIWFWIHKDAPIHVKEALALLNYTGIVKRLDSGVKGSHSAIGIRYEVNYGVFLSQISNPSKHSKDIIARLQINQFSEYGANHNSYSELTNLNIIEESEDALRDSLSRILQKPISGLDLTQWQKDKLIHEAKLSTIQEVIDVDENTLISTLYQVGVVRARQMKNAAYAEVLEYISG